MDREGLPDGVHKTYSTDQIASLSKLSIDMIRSRLKKRETLPKPSASTAF